MPLTDSLVSLSSSSRAKISWLIYLLNWLPHPLDQQVQRSHSVTFWPRSPTSPSHCIWTTSYVADHRLSDCNSAVKIFVSSGHARNKFATRYASSPDCYAERLYSTLHWDIYADNHVSIDYWQCSKTTHSLRNGTLLNRRSSTFMVWIQDLLDVEQPLKLCGLYGFEVDVGEVSPQRLQDCVWGGSFGLVLWIVDSECATT